MRTFFLVWVVLVVLDSTNSSGLDSPDDMQNLIEILFSKIHDLETGMSELREENRNLRAECTTTSSDISNISQRLQNDLKIGISELREENRNIRAECTTTSTRMSEPEITIRNILSNPYCKPKSCLEVQSVFNIRTSGVYRIYPIPTKAEGTEVYCDLETEGGGWTVFQSRSDKGLRRVDFYRGWADYEKGFGSPGNEHWMGLQNLAAMTSSGDQELLIKLGDWDNEFREAKYFEFKVADGSDKYRLHYKNYTGTAGDSLDYCNGMAFTTRDQDNDERDGGNCAQDRRGAWWYYDCTNANLNGDSNRNGTLKGIYWKYWRYPNSLKTVEMKIRTRGVL